MMTKDLIGKLLRLFDKRADVFGKSPAHQACRKALNDVLVKFEQWRHA
jgi:hypothetical protein